MYDFNAMTLAHKRYNPQLDHLGSMEFQIDGLGLGSNAQDVLTLGMQEFKLPEPRRVAKQPINYLNGVINVPGKPQAIGDLTCKFVDYIDGSQRLILQKWFDLVYNEKTGRGGLSSQIKVSAYAVLFGPNGSTASSYKMEGVWLQNAPPLPSINYSGGGSIVTMDMFFSVDFLWPDVINGQHIGASFIGGALLDSLGEARLGLSAGLGFGV
jgi:hypothetical protein